MNDYKTTLDQQYKFIELKSRAQVQTVDGNNVPLFLDPDCSPLDKYYQPISGPITATIDAKDQRSPIFRPQDFPHSIAPNPNDYMSQEEYESAAISWYLQANKHLSSVVLPSPITSYFSIPSLPKIFSQEEKKNPFRYKTFNPNVWPLLPKNYLHMINLLLSKDPINPDGQFPEQIPKRDPILYQHHITQDKQWMSQIITCEPKDFMYDSIEDFEKAYCNWATITYDHLSQPPIPPKQFGKIASLHYYNEPEKSKQPLSNNPNFRKRRRYPIKPIKKPNDTIDLTWSKSASVQSTDLISGHLNELSNSMPNMELANSMPNPNKDPILDVFGISNRDNFIDEMMEFGYDQKALTSTKPVHPTYILRGEAITDTINIENQLQNTSSYKMSTFYDFIDYDLSSEQYKRILSYTNTSSNNSESIANAVDHFFKDQYNIFSILSYAQRTSKHPYRLSYFLRALLTASSKFELLSTITQPSNINLFYHFVVILNLTSQERVPILPLMNNLKNTSFMTINQFYLAHCLLILFNENDGPQLFSRIREKCRSLFLSVYRVVHSDDKLLYNLRYSAVDSDEYKALLMLVQSESTPIHQAIFSDNFIVWMNKGPTRPVLLSTISHSTSIASAANIFIKKCDKLIQYYGFESLKPPICSFIASICKYICDYSPANIRFSGNSAMPFFNQLLRCEHANALVILEPISRILSSFNLISNFSTSEYRQSMADVINLICQQIVETSSKYSATNNHTKEEESFYNEIYIIRMKALLNFFAYYESLFPVILKINGFPEELVTYLNNPTEKVMRITWKFFNKFTQDVNVLEDILKSPKVQPILSAIFYKDNTIAKRKMLKFSTKVWQNPDPKYLPSKKYLCTILNPVITIIIKAFTNRFTNYKNEVLFHKKMQDFFDAINQLSAVPGCQEFSHFVMKRVQNDVSILKGKV